MEDRVDLMIRRAILHGQVKSSDDVVEIKKLQDRIHRKLFLNIDYTSLRRRVKEFIDNRTNK